MKKTPATSITTKFQQAIAIHQQGNLRQAELLYREILQAQPNHADALHLLGVVALQTGRARKAVDLISKALTVNPDNAFAYYDLGNAFLHLNRQKNALDSFTRALTLKPDYIDALHNRGIALLNLQQFEDALACFDRLLTFKPDDADVHYNRGNALLGLKKSAKALSSYDRALTLKPNDIDTLINRGIALLDLQHFFQALNNFNHTLEIKPDDIDSLMNRGLAFLALNQAQKALIDFKRILTFKPNDQDALKSCSIALFELKQFAAAVKTLSGLLAIAPDYPYAQGDLLHLQLHCADWSDYNSHKQSLTNAVIENKRANVPFAFLMVSSSAALQQQCARIFTLDKYPAKTTPLSSNQAYQHSKIRVAYISADFKNHPTSHLIAGLIETHNQDEFEFFGLSLSPEDKSPIGNRIKAAFKHFYTVHEKSDYEVALLLRELEIDIAIDLMGFTARSRTAIFAYRPAPIQVNYLGFPGTMATDYMDYIIADSQVIPFEHQRFYSEKIAYLPNTYQVNDAKRPMIEETPSREDVNLPDSGFVFCCFNSNYKITPDVFDIWMRLLTKVSGSVLWLLEESRTAVDNLKHEAQLRGVAPERLIFAPKIKQSEHIARQRLADLFLDTLPVNAHTTASDALWAGLPVLTCTGSAFAGRVAGSLLKAIGLPELITDNFEEYEALALKLATHPAELAGIKAKLAVNRNTQPLFNTDQFRKHLESAYKIMWGRFQQGNAPESFSVQL